MGGGASHPLCSRPGGGGVSTEADRAGQKDMLYEVYHKRRVYGLDIPRQEVEEFTAGNATFSAGN